MQVQVVRHDCRTQNTDGGVQHLPVCNYARLWDEPLSNCAPLRLGSPQLVSETRSNGLHKACRGSKGEYSRLAF